METWHSFIRATFVALAVFVVATIVLIVVVLSSACLAGGDAALPVLVSLRSRSRGVPGLQQ